MDLTEQHLQSVDSLPDQTDVLLERIFVDYIRNGDAGLGSTEPRRLVIDMAGQAGSKYKDQFEEFYRGLDGRGGGFMTTENAAAVAEELIGRCIGDGSGDGGCNRGRVAASLAFSRLVAGKLAADGQDGEFLDAYSTSVGKSLVRFVREWENREGQDLDLLQTTNRWTAGAFVSCFGAFVKVGAFAVTYANEAIR